jgi:hypothetical protein
MADSFDIRPARPEEAPQLTEVALCSKASWGYEAAFLEAVRDELTFTAEDLGLGPIFVLDLEGVIAVSTASAGSRPTGC